MLLFYNINKNIMKWIRNHGSSDNNSGNKKMYLICESI